MTRVHGLVTRGLEQTAARFVPVAARFGWVYRAAYERSNPAGAAGARVHDRWAGVVRGMGRAARAAPRRPS